MGGEKWGEQQAGRDERVGKSANRERQGKQRVGKAEGDELREAG